MVYIDPPFSVRSSTYSHMAADTVEELHAFAAACGIGRHWFHTSNSGIPHYDLNVKNRAAAVANGAVEMSRREFFLYVSSK